MSRAGRVSEREMLRRLPLLMQAALSAMVLVAEMLERGAR